MVDYSMTTQKTKLPWRLLNTSRSTTSNSTSYSDDLLSSLSPLCVLEGVLGERERAHAILLACRHLPLPLLTPPGHRARLLAEAKRTLERVGDRRSVQDCQQILLRLGGGTTIAAS